MANEEQLAILKQGTQAWNNWRENNPTAKIDFTFAKFVNINLSAYFEGPLITGINFGWADLRGANFTNANLEHAYLEDANLHTADLQRANLRGANLQGTKFRSTRLLDANLAKAIFSYTVITSSDLSTVLSPKVSIEP